MRQVRWERVQNVKTRAFADALEITEDILKAMKTFIVLTTVKPGWWLVVYQDHSYRLFNPENFGKSYVVIRSSGEKERIMTDFGQGNLPASEMGVAYTFVKEDKVWKILHYWCSECKAEVFFEKNESPGALALLDHARSHGVSAFTINGKTTGNVTLLFKRVTMMRDPRGEHHYECSMCLQVFPQTGMNGHSVSRHEMAEYEIDHTPAEDSWRPGTGGEQVSFPVSIPTQKKAPGVIEAYENVLKWYRDNRGKTE